MKQKKSKKEKMMGRNEFDPEKDHKMSDDYDEDDIDMDDNDEAEFSSDFDFEGDFFNDDSYDSSDSYLPLGNRRNVGSGSDDFFESF